MQLIIIWCFVLVIFISQEIKAQVLKSTSDDRNIKKTPVLEQTEEIYEKPDWKKIDIDFLSSYYSQDGNRSAVTGGIGTEQLTDFTQKVIVNVPINPKMSLNVDGGYDYYSSASTDNIDNIRSSDSSSDMRVHANVGLSIQPSRQHSFSFRAGGSTEYDYQSLTGGLSYLWLSKDENTMVGWSGQAFIDKWTLFYPTELRRRGRLVPTDNRQSYNSSLSLSRVLNKKMQVALTLEATLMNGLLSTPFHRVFFQEQEEARVESLPGTRWKFPIGARLNTHLSDWLISRLYYRDYWDDWGVRAHTASIELPIKLNRFLSVYPSYRYHTQTAADYFLPFKEHSLNNEWYTSDFDLAALDSHSFGAGISYAPANGLAKVHVPFSQSTKVVLSGIDIKYGHYKRSTGLAANIVSLGIKLEIR